MQPPSSQSSPVPSGLALAASAAAPAPGAPRAWRALPALVRPPRRDATDGLADAGVQPEVVRRDSIYRRALALADVAAAGLALLTAGVVTGADIVPGAALIPVFVLLAKLARLYDRDEYLLRKTTLEEAPALFQVATLWVLGVWLADPWLHRIGILVTWVSFIVLLAATRAATRWLVGRTLEPERCLILGNAVATLVLRRKLAGGGATRARIAGRIGLEPEGIGRAVPAGTPTLEDLPALIVEKRIDRVVVAPSSSSPDRALEAIRLAKSLGVKVSLLPHLFEAVGSAVEFDDVEGLTLLGVRRHGLSKSSRALKRAMDVAGAVVGLVLTAPLLAGIALMIRLDSPGPVLFRQRRIGREGRQFTMLKFRTMVVDADDRKHELLALNEADGLFKIADDPRITRAGRRLRRRSLDELPQLVNVLRGEMSLVGPRPLVPEDHHNVAGWERSRLKLTPGMTGTWQVLGSSRIPLREMVKIDYLYGSNWSVWMDVKILLRTVPYVLAKRGL